MAQNHVLVLHTDNGSACEVKYVTNIVYALREIGFKVNFLTTNSSLIYIHDVPHELVLPWIPKSIFGHCQKFCFITRSIFLSFYVFWNTRNHKPSLIITDGSPFVIPVLKYFNYQVCFINFMISFEKLITKVKCIKETSLEHSCLQRADNIIVLSDECGELLKGIDEKIKLVLPPIIDSLQFSCLTKLPQRANYFVILCDFNDTDQINMIIEAFVQLRNMLGLPVWNQIFLILLGCCGFDSTLLQKYIINLDKEVRVKIQLYEAIDLSIIRTYTAKCLAVFDIIKNTLWHTPLLTCMLAACPIVCLHDYNNKKLIENEITGLVIKNQVYVIRNCMHRLIKQTRWATNLGHRAALQVKNEFSRCIFRERLENIVSRHGIVKYYAPLPSFTSENTQVRLVESSRSNYDYKTCEN